MTRLAFALMMGFVAIFVQDSVALCRMCNVSRILGKEHDPRYVNYRSQAVQRDVAYLPEEDYVDEDGPLRENRNLMPEYRNLCEIVRKKVQLDDSEFEYQPPHYHETFCKSYSLLDESERAPSPPSRQKCAHPGFHCVQRSRTLFMVRRRWDSECWEPLTREIASGCDCMWPVSILGDIAVHY